MDDFFYFEKDGVKAQGEIIILKNLEGRKWHFKSESTILDKGLILRCYPNIYPLLGEDDIPFRYPVNYIWIEKDIQNDRLEDIQFDLMNELFSKHLKFRTLETKKIDYSQDTILKVESVQSGLEFNIPANSIFIYDDYTIGYNPKKFTSGTLSNISKIYYGDEFISLDKDLDNLISIYYVFKKKKKPPELIKIQNINIKNRTNVSKFLYEFAIKIEDYIEFIRNTKYLSPSSILLSKLFEIPNNPELNFKKIKLCLLLSKYTKRRGLLGNVIRKGNFMQEVLYHQKNSASYAKETWNDSNEDKFRFGMDALLYCPKYKDSYNPKYNHMKVVQDSMIDIYFERDKLNLNQIFICSDNLIYFTPLQQFIGNQIEDVNNKSENVINDLDILRNKRPESIRNFSSNVEKLFADFIQELKSKGFVHSSVGNDFLNKIIEIIKNL